MRKYLNGKAVLMPIIFLVCGAAHALTTWTLDAVRFDDGTSVIGYFSYEAATDTYSSWHVSVAAFGLPSRLYVSTRRRRGIK